MITGLYAIVNGLRHGRQWSVSKTSATSQIATNNSLGAMIAGAGVLDWSGSLQFYGHTPLWMPGEEFTFIGSTDGTNGVTGDAIVDSITITWNQETMAYIEGTVNFSGSGELTEGAVSATGGTWDAMPPQADENCIVNVGVGADIDVRTITMTLQCDNKAGADTSTGGWMTRKPGPLSGTVSWSRYIDDITDLGTINSLITAKLFVSSTLFWQLAYLRYAGYSDITSNAETGDIVSATENLVFSAANDTTIGSITKPSGVSAWWPPA